MKIGTLEIDLLANIARLRSDMDQAKGAVGDAMGHIQRSADMVKSAMGAAFLGFSVGAFAGWIKGAIDSADAFDEMSSRIGISAQELSGLSLSYKMAGMSNEDMAKSMAKLSGEIVSGNKTLDQFGIATRDANGYARNATEVLYDVADAFQGMEDGTTKTALAVQLFGKQGPELVGMLNGGSEGLREMTKQAEQLGLVVSNETAASAAKFNDTLDLLGGGIQGLAMSTAAELLPTLNTLAGAMLTSASSSQALSGAATVLSGALKLVFNAGQIVGEIFSVVGKSIGAVAAAAVSVAKGDFTGAWQIMKDADQDMRESVVGTGRAIAAVWDDTAGQSVSAMTDMNAASRRVKVETDAQAEATKKAADEAKKHAAELDKLRQAGLDLIVASEGQVRVLQQQIDLGRPLTDTEKALLDVEQKLAQGKVILSEADRQRLTDSLQQQGAMKAEADLQEALRKLHIEQVGAILDEAKSIEDLARQQEEENRKAGMTAEQLARLEVSRISDQLATAEQRLQTALLADVRTDELDGITMQVEALRRLKTAKEEGVILAASQEAAKAATETGKAWQQTTDSIYNGITDALMRGFEGGKSIADNFMDTLKNAFKSMVLQPTVKAVMAPVTGALGALMGNPASAATSSPFGTSTNGFGGMSWLTDFGGNVSNSLVNLSSWMGNNGMESAGTWLANNSMDIGGWAEQLGDVGGYLNAFMQIKNGNYGQGIGSAVGSYFGGPVGSMIGNSIGKLVDGFFGGKRTYHEGASAMADENSASTLANGTLFTAHTLRVNDELQDAVTGVAGQMSSIFNALGGGGYTVKTGFGDDSSGDGAWGALQVLLNGSKVVDWKDTQTSKWAPKEFRDGEEGWADYMKALASTTRQAIQSIDLPTWAKDQINALGTDATLDELQAVAAGIGSTIAGLSAMSDAFEPLGGIFSRISASSGEAQYQLAAFSGGVDALMANAKTFADLYYSDDEKQGGNAAALLAQFQSLGVAMPQTMEQYRALVESQNLQTETGRLNVAALLELSDEFASVQDYLAQYGGSLEALAAQAPSGAVYEQLTAAQQRQASMAEAAAEQAAATAAAAERTNTLLESMSDRLATKLDQVNDSLMGLRSDWYGQFGS